MDSKNKLIWGSIWVAIIAALGGITVALINGYFQIPSKPRPEPNLDAKISYVGVVRNLEDHKAIRGATIMIFEDQKAPETLFSDVNGAFLATLSRKTQSMKLWVIEDGYETYRLEAKPDRTGPQEIELQPLPSKSKRKLGAQTPSSDHAATRPDSSSIPSTSAVNLSNETLRTLANNLADKMLFTYSAYYEKDDHLLTSEGMASAEGKRRIENEREQLGKQYKEDTVGLVSDGNFLLDAIRPRVGPISDEWRTLKFQTANGINGDVLRQLAKRLGN